MTKRLLILTLLFFTSCSTTHRAICTHVEFDHHHPIDFSDNEKILLCGDQDKESWAEIPPAQAEFTLRNFLRQRGYFHPVFDYRPADKMLKVTPGEPRLIKSVEFENQPPEFDEIKLRGVVGEPLTSEQLDKVQNFAFARLKNLGYACPEIKITADETSGTVKAKVTAGPHYEFMEPLLIDDQLDLNEKAMRRFDAFKLGTPYRQDWVKLSSNRAENDGIVISSEFISRCPAVGPGMPMSQKIMGGEKRLLTIGAGISTEEFPIFQTSFKSVRLDDRGSNILFSLYGSQRRQTFQSTYTDYIFKNAPRFDFAPNVTVEHRKEPTYNSTQFQISAPLEYHGDGENHAWLASFGPLVSRVFSLDNTSEKSSTFFSFLGRLTFTTHDYELFQGDPRSGWIADFSVQAMSEGFQVDPFAMLYQLKGTHLFSLNAVDPPQWILGFRYGLATIDTKERPQDTNSRLTADNYRQLGGNEDLRGFGRKELTQWTIGALTSAFIGTELRYAKTWGLGIEPFVFFDAGALGSRPWQLDNTIYYSPGLGIRWNTPIGAVRGTFAHGYASRDDRPAGTDDPEHWQFFFSFGREF